MKWNKFDPDILLISNGNQLTVVDPMIGTIASIDTQNCVDMDWSPCHTVHSSIICISNDGILSVYNKEYEYVQSVKVSFPSDAEGISEYVYSNIQMYSFLKLYIVLNNNKNDNYIISILFIYHY